MSDKPSLTERLESDEFVREDILDALHGERLPDHLGYPLIKLCVIRGIRYSLSFAESEAQPLRGLAEHPEFTRAINARTIMSNQIPDMDLATHPEEAPYCIWHPDVASEDTYRKLATRYSQMRYQVARACAVAGYTELYLELDVLPEVSVAEEAREAGSDAIFTYIMSQPVRYKVMDDYFRGINLESPQVGYLNDDTCYLSKVKAQKQAFTKPADPDDFLTTYAQSLGFDDKKVFNLTEDMGIAESESEAGPWPSSSRELMLDLVTSPLPADLPAGNKNLLILTAAFYGNIDRYARLRRPRNLEDEVFCVVRGIYHNSLFAIWWSRQQEVKGRHEPFWIRAWGHIQKAITARHIMNNDLSRIIARSDKKSQLPYLIWYPEVASPTTYEALAHRVPEMREACVRACIYANYSGSFDELLLLPGVVPNAFLLTEAARSSNPHYVSALRSRAEELGRTMSRSELKPSSDEWKLFSVKDVSFLGRSDCISTSIHAGQVFGEFIVQGAAYNGIRAEVDQLELMLMIPESWRPERRSVEMDYEEWPRSW